MEIFFFDFQNRLKEEDPTALRKLPNDLRSVSDVTSIEFAMGVAIKQFTVGLLEIF